MKDKRYFVEIVIKDSETLEPVRSITKEVRLERKKYAKTA